MSETEGQAETRRLVEFINRRGGAVTVRDVVTYYRPLKNQTKLAETALAALHEAGHGAWEPMPSTARGGKPTQRFRLHRRTVGVSASAKPRDPRGKSAGIADADSVEQGESRGNHP